MLKEEVTILGPILVPMLEDVVVDLLYLIEKMSGCIGLNGNVFTKKLTRTDICTEIAMHVISHLAVCLIEVV